MIGNGVVVDPRRPDGGDRRAARARRRRAQPAPQRQRAPDHALPPDARPRRRGEARQARDRHDQARHRPLLRRQGGAPGDPRAGPARREDPQAEDHGRARAQEARCCARSSATRARPARDDRAVPALRPPPRAAHRRHRHAAAPPARRRAARRSSRARRPRCSTSTTAPIRSSPRPTRWPARRASAPASARATSPRSGASRRPTRRASAPGPFPTELDDDLGEEIRQRGGEFGTTTGRPRRTGWTDLVALRYAARINGMTALVITKLDVLSGFGTLKVCTALPEPRRRRARDVPLPPDGAPPRAAASTRSCRAGKRTSPAAAREDELPQAARDYLQLHRGLRRRSRDAARRRPGARPDRLGIGERSPLVRRPPEAPVSRWSARPLSRGAAWTESALPTPPASWRRAVRSTIADPLQ